MARYDYDIGILGGGAAGLTVAAGAAQLDAKTLLVEKAPKLGGDCLHYGCVPPKTLIRTAGVRALAARSAELIAPALPKSSATRARPTCAPPSPAPSSRRRILAICFSHARAESASMPKSFAMRPFVQADYSRPGSEDRVSIPRNPRASTPSRRRERTGGPAAERVAPNEVADADGSK